MRISEYRNIFENEGNHFFYVGNHFIILNLIKKYIKKKPVSILDAGCGTGLLAKKLQALGHVEAVDISPEAIKYANKRGIPAKLASITNLPFKNNSFDLVVSADVLYHKQVVNDIKAFAEFKRVLKPGGILILKVPAYNWLRGGHDVVVHTKYRYTAGELNRLTEKAGMEALKVSYFASFLLPLAIIKRLMESIFSSHNAESDVSLPPTFVNNLMNSLYKLESLLMNFVNIPFGLSALVVAKKLKKQASSTANS